jgi:hypothetical protein
MANEKKYDLKKIAKAHGLTEDELMLKMQDGGDVTFAKWREGPLKIAPTPKPKTVEYKPTPKPTVKPATAKPAPAQVVQPTPLVPEIKKPFYGGYFEDPNENYTYKPAPVAFNGRMFEDPNENVTKSKPWKAESKSEPLVNTTKIIQQAKTAWNRKVLPYFTDEQDTDKQSKTQFKPKVDTVATKTYDYILGEPIQDYSDAKQVYQHRSKYIDLTNPKIKTAYHNRGDKKGDNQPFKQVLFSNFDNNVFDDIHYLKRTNKLNPSEFYIGTSSEGKLIMGSGAEIANVNGAVSKFSIIKNVKGFKKDPKTGYKIKKSPDSAGHDTPFFDTDSGDVVTNILTSRSKSRFDEYGDVSGGSFIMMTPDKKVKVLASGSANELSNAIEKFKKDNKVEKLDIIKVDNGSYARTWNTNRNIVDQKFWDTYEGQNTRGGNAIYEYKNGGYVDSVLNANKNLEWVKRLYDENPQSIMLPGESNPSTHFMESSDNLVYPTIIQNGEGKLEYLGKGARDYAIKNKTFIEFPTENDAIQFGKNYKSGTGVLKKFKEGGFTESPWQKAVKQQIGKQQAQEQESLRQYLQKQSFKEQQAIQANSKVVPAKKQGAASKALEVAANPVAAVRSINEKGYVPDNFSMNESSPATVIDAGLAYFNPAFYANAANRTGRNLSDPKKILTNAAKAPFEIGQVMTDGYAAPGYEGSALSTLGVAADALATGYAGSQLYRAGLKYGPQTYKLNPLAAKKPLYSNLPKEGEMLRNPVMNNENADIFRIYNRGIDKPFTVRHNVPKLNLWDPSVDLKNMNAAEIQKLRLPENINAKPHWFDGYPAAEFTETPIKAAIKGRAIDFIESLNNKLNETPIINQAYKLNPKAFKPKDSMLYRGIGPEGAKDAIESRVFRANPDVQPVIANDRFDISKQFNKPYFTPKFNTAETYSKGYIAEVPEDAATFRNRYKRTNWSKVADEDIPVDKGKIYKKDWLQGWKETPESKAFTDIKGIDKTNWKKLMLGHNLAKGQGGAFNNGVFMMKKPYDQFVVKVEDAQKFSKLLNNPEYMNYDYTGPMKGISPENISKVYKQFDLGDGKRALIQNRVYGKSLTDLNINDIKNIPEQSWGEMLKSLNKIRKNDMSFDFHGNNFYYDPTTKKFKLFDIGSSPSSDKGDLQVLGHFSKDNTDDLFKAKAAQQLQDKLKNLSGRHIGNTPKDTPPKAYDDYADFLENELPEIIKRQKFKKGGAVAESTGLGTMVKIKRNTQAPASRAESEFYRTFSNAKGLGRGFVTYDHSPQSGWLHTTPKGETFYSSDEYDKNNKPIPWTNQDSPMEWTDSYDENKGLPDNNDGYHMKYQDKTGRNYYDVSRDFPSVTPDKWNTAKFAFAPFFLKGGDNGGWMYNTADGGNNPMILPDGDFKKKRMLMEDIYKYNLSNPDLSRREAWKDSRKFVNKEVMPLVNSDFYKHYKQGIDLGRVDSITNSGVYEKLPEKEAYKTLVDFNKKFRKMNPKEAKAAAKVNDMKFGGKVEPQTKIINGKKYYLIDTEDFK